MRPLRIALCYDQKEDYLAEGLSAEEVMELDDEETIEGIASALRGLGHTVERVGRGAELARRLASGQPSGERWDLVFNIAEGLSGVAREAQIPALLDVYGIAYTFSDPLVMALTLHKGLTKTVVAAGGVPTPEFAVVEQAADIERIDLPFPLFAKPVGEGTGKGITRSSKISDPAALRSVVGGLLANYCQPVIVETFLPGREFTVGITGTGAAAVVVATVEIVLLTGAEADAYSYVNKERCEELVEYRLVHAADDSQVAEAERFALAAWRILNCRDGGRVDLRCDAAGAPSFLEVNPLAGLHPEHSDLPILATKSGLSYAELIGRIVASAEPRVVAAKQSKARRFRPA